MTDEQKDALVGKLVLEHGELKGETGTLRAACKKIGQTFQSVGNTLIQYPERLIFLGESYDGRFHAATTVKIEEIDGKKLLELTNEIRAKIVRQDDVTSQLKGMGVDVSHP
ncbi:MAG: hypothetical protein LAN84_03340 [Acidobacteriia bacterium]|nr:hypothetical protein [Terriglobia bacterium]